jgi:hypothetical protein
MMREMPQEQARELVMKLVIEKHHVRRRLCEVRVGEKVAYLLPESADAPESWWAYHSRLQRG